MSYCLPHGYVARMPAVAFDDHEKIDQSGVTYQPDVYSLAAVVARHASQNFIVDLGCGSALKSLKAARYVIGFDIESNVETLINKHGTTLQSSDKGEVNGHQWYAVNFERDLNWVSCVPSKSVVVCADVLEHLVTPDNLLAGIASLVNDKDCTLILSTPDRMLAKTNRMGPPANPRHCREWTLSELVRLLAQFGIDCELSFHTRNHDQRHCLRSTITVVA